MKISIKRVLMLIGLLLITLTALNVLDDQSLYFVPKISSGVQSCQHSEGFF